MDEFWFSGLVLIKLSYRIQLKLEFVAKQILGNVAINYLVYKRFGTGSSNESWSRRRSPGGRDGDVSMYTYVLETLDLSGGVCVLLYPLPATLIYTLSTSRCNAKIDRGAGFSWMMTSQAAGLCIMNWRSLILSSYMSSTKPTPRLLLLVLVWMFSKFNYQSTPSSGTFSWTTKFRDASVPNQFFDLVQQA
ncbi:uncharacterized protein LOC119363700 isoform X2 [Triticum dicoccoides]|uniref:uncharacterized protein LOC119363700 isoform X2 n=1 Tax=Triticum dicoccoides TaxID=85692 RepID=UPI0018908F5D|nr:uncharacterized protein LOC119363700 isoform X2 [Triticum dicoccoides]